MEILFPTIGSAGDVHPVVGIGAGLKRRGHRVTIVTSPVFEPLVSREGLELIPLGTREDYETNVNDPDLWHPRKGFEVVARMGILPALREIYEIVRGHDPANTIVATSALCMGARLAQEKLGYRVATVHLQPALLRSLYRTPVYPGMRLPDGMPRFLKRWAYVFVDRVALDRVIGSEINAFRVELGLPPVQRFFDGWMHSPARIIGLYPDWFARPQPDWPPGVVLTGFPGYDAGQGERRLPDDLVEFLDAGDPPLAFTPGTAMAHGERFFEAAVGACLKLGRRGLLLTRHRAQLPRELPPGVMHVDYAPFRALLPRVAALAYHGGIGTMAQALAAGIPQLIMPMAHDQPDNASRVERLGVGTTLSPRRFRAAAAASRLDGLLGSDEVLRRCRELASKVDFEAAIERACDAIESLAAESVVPR